MKVALWVSSILLITFSLYVTVVHWGVFINNHIQKGRKWVSAVPFVGGLCGLFGLLLLPVHGVSRYCWVPLVVDWGSLPVVTVSIVHHLRDRKGIPRSGDENSEDADIGDSYSAAEVIGRICSEFERLNDFSRSLSRDDRFRNTTTSANIRKYETGWMLEKYVETVLRANEGLTAVWAMEVSFEDDAWRIWTNTSISYGDYDEDVDTFRPPTIAEFGLRLGEAIDNLCATASPNAPFRREIERILA